ncbi:MAG: GNAT family N-acetyltransferase [Dehalococcoidia bacterium]|nr:GNAT family N-acetyltransferase [Dehalococcoidia bacterium]
MEQVDIREARDDELDAAAAVIASAYEQYRPAIPVDAWEGYQRDMMDVRGRLASSKLLVAAGAAKVLGCVTYFPAASESWPAGGAYIRLLAVAPIGRGLGLGRRLTEACVERARAAGISYIGLHTTSLMEVARAMYERMGFVRLPEADFHPTPQMTVMAYRLDL